MEVRARHCCLLFVCCVLLLGSRAHALELNGVASFNELGEEIYLAGLYVGSRTTAPASLFSDLRERKMEVRFSSSMSRRRWTTNWMQSIAINNSREHLEAAVGELSDVLGVFKGNLFRGDRVEIHYVPGQGTEVRVNGHVLASGHSADVFNLFLSSWLGPVPPSSQFRNQLLGVEESPDSTRFVTLQPALDRIETVAVWAAPAEAEPAVEDTVAASEEAPAEEAVDPEMAPPVIAPPTLAAADEPEPEAAAAQPEPAESEPAPQPAPQPAPEPVPTEQLAAAPAATESRALEDDDDEEVDLSVEAILSQRDYMSRLIGEVYSNLRYPERAVRRNYEGSVRMRLIIRRDGSLADMQLLEESRHAMLNAEAERAVRAAAPFAAIPDEVRSDQMEVELPINFRLE